ncbi:MAG: histidine phosphatase family protein, partial [Chloroflexi bacterium]|nr:histidine phosphatase family protein [Chloroflexota bacterium]
EDGEPLRLVQRRVSSWLENEIIFNRDLVGKAMSMRVAIVGHGAASKTLFQYIMGFDSKYTVRIGMDNCSISRFIFNKDGWYPICINDGAHLQKEAQGGLGSVDIW